MSLYTYFPTLCSELCYHRMAHRKYTHIQDIKLRVIINLKKYHQPKPLCAALLCNLFFEFQIKVNIVNITDKICTRPGWVLFSHS